MRDYRPIRSFHSSSMRPGVMCNSGSAISCKKMCEMYVRSVTPNVSCIPSTGVKCRRFCDPFLFCSNVYGYRYVAAIVSRSLLFASILNGYL